MARKYAIPVATELQNDTLFTGVFASGDERRYMRLFCYKVHQNPTLLGTTKVTTIEDVEALFDEIASIIVEAKLISIVGVFHDDDDSDIPNGDSGRELSAYVLMTDRKPGMLGDPKTFQVRIPKLSGIDGAALWLENSATWDTKLDVLTDSEKGMRDYVSVNFKPEHKARASA